MNQELELKVCMLGKFTVSLNGIVIISEGTRSTKSILLLEYLLISKNKKASQEDLIKLLQISDESDNPYNVLKNIVYRLRKLFEIEGVPKKDWVSFKKNYYCLSEDVSYNIDAVHFMKISKLLADKSNNNNKLDLAIEALELYNGDFLPKQSSEMWVISESVKYQNAYASCLKEAYFYMKEAGKISDLLEYLNQAVYMYPYEEGIQALRILCLVDLGLFDEATKHYNNVTMMLLDELGNEPGEEIKNAYKKISDTIHGGAISINEIREDIKEKEVDNGAYFCNINAFTSTYHFVVRNFERNGQPVFLILCTLQNPDGSSLKRGEIMSKACQNFYVAAKTGMRRGDIYTRYSPCQFLILVTNINQENCKIVTNRSEKNFLKLNSKKNVELMCQVIPAVDMDNIINMGSQGSQSLQW